jgi:uncharacterized protein DUF6766
MKRLWRDYGLSITLGLLFLGSFVGHTVSGWYQYAAEQREHGSEPTLFGDDGYGWVWAEWTLQNWQSEFLELTTFVVLSSFLIHKGSPESRDGDDEMQATLDRIEKRLDELEGPEGPKDRTNEKQAA